jgi:hypothetical protein
LSIGPSGRSPDSRSLEKRCACPRSVPVPHSRWEEYGKMCTHDNERDKRKAWSRLNRALYYSVLTPKSKSHVRILGVHVVGRQSD